MTDHWQEVINLLTEARIKSDLAKAKANEAVKEAREARRKLVKASKVRISEVPFELDS